MEAAHEFKSLIEKHFEWLAVHENGRTLALRSDEIEIEIDRRRALVGFVDENGFSLRRFDGFITEGSEIVVKLSAGIAKKPESVRLVPRIRAAELAADVEIARLQKANEVAATIARSFPGLKLEDIRLHSPGGRLARAIFRSAGKARVAVQYDVTGKLTHENLLASAMKWTDELGSRRKDPISEVWIAAEKKQARAVRKLAALLSPAFRSTVGVVEIVRSGEEPDAKFRDHLSLSDLWREKPRKLAIPSEVISSRTSRMVIEIDPSAIDAVFSKQGETLRYNGLPFARVRQVMGRERAWFGIGRKRRPLTLDTADALNDLAGELRLHRSSASLSRRHEYHRLASEAWLESILRRNIKLLDPNLELAPIYNQFRSAGDKIDLLAIRKDGRLVVIELKTSPDRDSVFQAADYWRRIELQRRKGILREARLFGEKEIADRPALVYAVAPALSFHRDWEYFARMLAPEIEMWRWELHEDWRKEVKVIARINCGD